MVDDLEAGVTADASYTVQEAVADFLDHGMKGKSPGTVANYRSIADHHLIPFIGGSTSRSSPPTNWTTGWTSAPRNCPRGTLRLMHQILERAIRQAQARDKVRRNVASLVDVPEGQEGRPSRAMTLDQAVSSWRPSSPAAHRLAAYVVLSLLAGVRTEEARAITWDEVDLKAGTVAVYRSVRAKGDTKTRKSRRVLKLPERAVEALKRAPHPPGRRTARARASAWQDHGLVFCREDGTPLDRWQVRKEFAEITKAARLGGGVDAHESYGTRSCPSSAPTMSAWRTSATWSGHSSTTVTETVYRHEIRPALTKGATAMNRILTKKRTPARLPTGEPATPRLTSTQPPAAQPASRRTTPAKPRARRRA